MNNINGLVARELSRNFGAHKALVDLNLTVSPGEVVALLGPNGSGKSTTIKILGGVLAATGGEVTLGGVSLLSEPLRFKQNTGFVPDVGGLFPRLTAWEHMELNARLRKLSDWEPKARLLLERLDLAQVAGNRASSYSHGMSRKLSAAVAFLSNPALLLLDEPFDGVDPVGVDTLVELVSEARARGASVLISTHLLDVAESLAERVYVLRHGTLKAAGSPTELIKETSALNLSQAYKSFLA